MTLTREQIELKPCPLCGGAVHWCGTEPDEDGDTHDCHQITCRNCGQFDLNGDGMGQVHTVVAERWNRRALSALPAEPVAINQCDGCRRGLSLENGTHYQGTHLVMRCTADRYAHPPREASEDEKNLARRWANQVDSIPLTSESAVARAIKDASPLRETLSEERIRDALKDAVDILEVLDASGKLGMAGSECLIKCRAALRESGTAQGFVSGGVLSVLKDAEEFVNRHSEEWYVSGQELLKRIRDTTAALAAKKSGVDHE